MSEEIKLYAHQQNYEELIKEFPDKKKLIDSFIKERIEIYKQIPFNDLHYPYGFYNNGDSSVIPINQVWKDFKIPEIDKQILIVVEKINKEKKRETIPEPVKKKKKRRKVESILTREGQIVEFWEKQQFFYDKSKIFYLWNDSLKKWEISDEVDFLNSIRENLGLETFSSKDKTELINGFQQVGRKQTPRRMGKTWVQFKNKIYDGKTGKFLFEASPEYFVKNPIPWNLGKSEETPTIDKFFSEWVGEENKIRLYELFAYAITPDRFMQRIFALCGGGSNGKGTCINHLLRKFIGQENIVSSDIKILSESRFETASLFGKLVCVMGEVSYDDLKNTNQLKKLAGEDLMRYELKNKMPFTDENTALPICLTNSLPTTPDKSLGFYRKWNIMDFPVQFPKLKEDLIQKIPEVEFESLALKCLNILKGLYANPEFTSEGNFEERIKRYEEKSNPVMQFIEERCEEEPNSYLTIRDFTNRCNIFLKNKHLRVLTSKQIGKILREEGFIVGNRQIKEEKIGEKSDKNQQISAVVILNLRFKGGF